MNVNAWGSIQLSLQVLSVDFYCLELFPSYLACSVQTMVKHFPPVPCLSCPLSCLSLPLVCHLNFPLFYKLSGDDETAVFNSSAGNCMHALLQCMHRMCRAAGYCDIWVNKPRLTQNTRQWLLV